MNDPKLCGICDKPFTEWGNNPWPILNHANAVCCDSCNDKFVIPARILNLQSRSNNHENN
jgi:hydrogenase maturation factor HypF (carbamoyltransferase family)